MSDNKPTSLTRISPKAVTTTTSHYPIASLPPGDEAGDTPGAARNWCYANLDSERLLYLSEDSFRKLSAAGSFDLISEITDWFLGDGEDDIVYEQEHKREICEKLREHARFLKDPGTKYIVLFVANLAELSYAENTPSMFAF